MLAANVFAPDVSRNLPHSQDSGIEFLQGVYSLDERRGKNLTLGCPVVDGLIDLASPLIRKFNDKARPGRGARHRKKIVQDGALLIAVTGFTQRVSEGPVEIEHAWRLHQRSRFFYIGEGNCGHATGFNLARQQSHGPRAGRSGRYQDDEIDACLRKERTDLTSGCQKVAGIIGKAKAIVDIGHEPDHTLFLQLKQALQGKDQVRIADGIAAVIVFVRDTEICVTVSTLNDAKRSVCLQIERRIGAEMDTCCAYDSNCCLSKRSLQWRPGDIALKAEFQQPKLQVYKHLAEPARKAFSRHCIIYPSQGVFSSTIDGSQSIAVVHRTPPPHSFCFPKYW